MKPSKLVAIAISLAIVCPLKGHAAFRMKNTDTAESRQKTKKDSSASSTKNRWRFIQDVLYWKADEDRLQFANKPSLLATTDDFTQTSLLSPHFQWNWGIRETLACQPAEWDWSFSLEWAYIKNRAHRSIETNAGEGISPVGSLLPDTQRTDFVEQAHSRWNVRLNNFAGKATYHDSLFPWLNLSPYAGIRGVIIDQGVKLHYAGGSLIGGTENIHMTNDFFGIGPEIGINPHILLGKQWTIFSLFSFAPLGGRFHVQQKDRYTATDSFHHSKSFWHLQYVIDAAIGLEWLATLSNDRYAIGLRDGWEYHHFFSQNQWASGPLHLLKGNRNLVFKGWTLSLVIGF